MKNFFKAYRVFSFIIIAIDPVPGNTTSADGATLTFTLTATAPAQATFINLSKLTCALTPN